MNFLAADYRIYGRVLWVHMEVCVVVHVVGVS